MNRFVLLYFSISLICVGVSIGQSQKTGVISGIILDARGNPLPDALVTVRRLDRSASTGLRRKSVSTDPSGKFSVEGCAFGNYFVLVSDTRALPASSNQTLPENSALSTVAVLSTLPAANVTIQLGRHTAVVEGRIRDAVTGQPISGAQLQIKSISTGQTWMSAGVPSAYHLTVPRSADMSLQISAPGYASWYYPSGRRVGNPALDVKLDSLKQINISLNPLSQ